MSVTSVKARWDDSGDDDQKSSRFSNEYIVLTDSFDDDEAAVLEALPIKPGNSHRSGKAICLRRTAVRQAEGALSWICTIEYGPRDENGNTTGSESDIDSFPEISITQHEVTIARDHDYFGDPLLNSARERFQNGDEFPSEFTVIEITARRTFDKLTLATIDEWRNVVHGPDVPAQFVNNPLPQFLGIGNFPLLLGQYGACVARLTSFGANTERVSLEDGTQDTAWRIRLQISLSDTWLGSALDEGLTQVANLNLGAGGNGGSQAGVNSQFNLGERFPIRDAKGFVVTTPVLLDGNGLPLADGGQVKFLVWQRYPHANLNNLLGALDLPLTLGGYRFKEGQ